MCQTDRRTDVQPIAKMCFSIADSRKNDLACIKLNCGLQPVKTGVNSGCSLQVQPLFPPVLQAAFTAWHVVLKKVW